MTDLAALVEESGDDFGLIWPEVALHPDAALLDYPVIVADDGGARLLATGRVWNMPDVQTHDSDGVVDGTRVRAYDDRGALLGVLEWSAGLSGWRPVKMVG